ncbi:MAG: CRISPR-associated ring nuclease Csm6 [Thiobacillus sp.]
MNRNILICVTGLSPQIVTETVYALSMQATPAWMADEIYLLTTQRGAENARLKLLSREPGWFHRLRADYGLPEIRFDESHVHVIRRQDGTPLDDIRDDADNRCAADFIADTVRRLTQDPETEVHASIAGGRKTMGFYLGYAMSLYGRAQDRLSHVLVSAPFESHPEFYYPTPQTRVITSLDRGQDALDCSQARVWLGDIPFVRLREGLPERLLEGKAGFSEAVAAAGRAMQAPRLWLGVSQCMACADGERLDLGPTEFSVLLWFARQACADSGEIDWTDAGAVSTFLAVARQVMKPASGEYERLEKALNGRLNDAKLLGDYFEPQKSRINKILQKTLGKFASARYAIRRTGPRGASRYSLPLDARQIEIED